MAGRQCVRCTRSSGPCLQLCLMFLVISGGCCLNLNTACLEVKKAYAEKGFDENQVPITAVPGADLSICPHTETCCTRPMEEQLLSLSRKEHSRQLDQTYQPLKTNFATRARKFDEFFTELVDKAKRDLHEMFVKTYGLLYQQNAHMFGQLFQDLRGYYKGRDLNLMEVMDNFFSRLFQRMFELLNSNYKFDSDYLVCVGDKMDAVKPFGDQPHKLAVQVKRSFIAARTFVQGLAIGRDVITTVMEVAPSESCLRAMVKMSYCPLCRGLSSTKPCSNYCLNTMKGCLAQQADLNQVWNSYLDALQMLASRLEGPFNIEAVVDPMDVKISEAIMNLQESSEKISQLIFTGCGTPLLARERRDSGNPPEPDQDKSPYELGKSGLVRPTSAAGTVLEKLVRDVKDRVKNAKDFWVRLPYAVCNDEKVAADAAREEDCWNGQDRARYMPEVQKDGVLHQINNPEVEVDVSKVNSLISRQKLQLQLITNKLQNAYRGEDVDWIDTEMDGMVSGSGSGDFSEGSGSGAGVVTDDEKEGIVDIDASPTHSGGTKVHSSSHPSKGQGTASGPDHGPREKEPTREREDQTPPKVEDPRSQDGGRGKGQDRKDDRKKGERSAASSVSSLTWAGVIVGLRLLWCFTELSSS